MLVKKRKHLQLGIFYARVYTPHCIIWSSVPSHTRIVITYSKLYTLIMNHQRLSEISSCLTYTTKHLTKQLFSSTNYIYIHECRLGNHQVY